MNQKNLDIAVAMKLWNRKTTVGLNLYLKLNEHKTQNLCSVHKPNSLNKLIFKVLV